MSIVNNENTGVPTHEKADTAKHEKAISEFWKEFDVYAKILVEDENKTHQFEFMDGPPFCSGTLHHGHLSVGTLKDTMLRFMRMHGFNCKNRLGFDCHGLPVETIGMNGMALQTSADIAKIGISTFNEYCKAKVMEFAGSWEPIYDKCGRWADFKNVYRTLDTNFMESTWWAFGQLHKKGLVYHGSKVMAYSWKLETPLSNFEGGQNYKEIETKSIYVEFSLKSDSNVKLVAWTTTPYSLPANLALCVNPSMNYVICTVENGTQYILGETSVQNVKLDFIKVEFYGKGSDLVGIEYKPLFN
jgi:isoleucyl-tRNA synthetase